MAPPLIAEIRLLLILAAMFILPGSALLVISGTWRRWSGLQLAAVAVGLSLSSYPILFYATRFILPGAQLGPGVMGALLLLALAVTLWGIWRYGTFRPKLDWLEWAALFIIALTLLSRFWFANVYPFPAWSDSLHHTLLTELTAVNGRLPTTLEPYFPNKLDMYHLGLYALSGTAQMLAQVPAHSALLWTAQFLNGLCGLGIYLILDRYASRPGAVVATAVAGLFSAHPALWGNWGRFTQLASLIVLPISWQIILDTLLPPTPDETAVPPPDHHSIWLPIFAAITTTAVFFFHFRVAIFYALLLLPTFFWALWRTQNRQQRQTLIKTTTLIGGLSLLLILPVLADAAAIYFAKTTAPAAITITNEEREEARQSYYAFPLSSIPYLAAPVWLLITTALGIVVGLIRRRGLILINAVWVGLLVILGNLYLLGIPVLNVTNLGAILIMLYLPISLIVGTAVTELLNWIPPNRKTPAVVVLIAAVLLLSLPAARTRANTVEAYRHFVTPDDIVAMDWINDNLPQDATFAINTYFWFPTFAHGTDAGYWIPYFTQRHIVTSAMLSDGLSPDYRQQVLAQSQASELLETDLTAVTTLYNMGVHYIYIGAMGDFSGPGLPLAQLATSDRVTLLYQQGSAAIFEIKPPQ